jgi:hypothetical protein
LLTIAPRIPHPLATVAAWCKRWTSRYLLATLSLTVKVRWPVWTTIGTLLAGTIPLLGVILEHFRTKQVNETFDL